MEVNKGLTNFDSYINTNSTVINYLPNFAMYSVYIKMFGAKEEKNILIKI